MNLKFEIYNLKLEKGIATLEILIAMVIMVLAITAVMPLIFSGQNSSISSQTYQGALYKAQAFLQTAKANAQVDFNLVNPKNAVADGMYQKSLDVQQIDAYTKKVTGTVTWQASGSQNFAINLSTMITNPDGVASNAVCNSVLKNANGWKNPITYHWDLGQLGVNNSNGNGFAISNLFLYGQRLYATMSDTPNNDKDTFFVFDLPSDASQPPVYRGSIDNSSSVNTANLLLAAVTVSGNYAYVVNAYTGSASNCTVNANHNCGQLQVIDVSNATPVIVKDVKIAATTSNGKLAAGSSIFYSNGYVYVGLAKASGSGSEFNVIDVGGGGASPANPVLRGSFAVGNGISSIVVKDNYAYVTSPNTSNILMIKIKDANGNVNPSQAGYYSPPAAPDSNGVGSNYGESSYVVGTTVYLGRTYGTNEFYILDTSNATSPMGVIAAKDIGTTQQTSVNGLAVRDYLAFLITKSQFQVWNIANTGNIQPWTSDGTVNTFLNLSSAGGAGTALYCGGDYFYVALASSQGNSKDIISVIVPGP